MSERLIHRWFPSLDRQTGRWMLRVLRTGLIALVTVLASVLHDRGVDADVLIERASQAERVAPPGARVVSLTFRQDTGESVHIVRQVGVGSSVAAVAVTSAPDEVPSAFRPALRAMGFDWQRPLTIDTVARYRRAHPVADRSEHVTRSPDGSAFVLTTTALADVVHELQAIVDAESYQVVRLHLTFPGIGTLDIDDLTRSSAYLPRRSGMPVIRPSRDELDRAELQVRLVLAETGVDLDQRVQISRTPESVRVQTPTNRSGGRWDPEVNTQLRALAHVHVELFKPGTGTAVVPTDSAASPDSSPTRFGLARWRERRFGHSAARASILPRLLESLLTVRRRLAVLADLATRYPNPRRDLSSDARALLGQLVERHHRRLRVELTDTKDGIFGLWGPRMLRQEPRHAPGTLISHAPVALSRARALETLVRTSIAQDDLTPEQEQQLPDAFEALWAALYGPAPTREPGSCIWHDHPRELECAGPRR